LYVAVRLYTYEPGRGSENNLSVGFRGAAIVTCGLLLAAACARNYSQTQQPGAQNQVLTAPTGATIAHAIDPCDFADVAEASRPVQRSAQRNAISDEVGKIKVGLNEVRADVEAEKTPALEWELWLRKKVIGKIPGA
jgi:hypothetical protein